MADWNNPLLTSTYTNFMQELINRDVDCAKMDPNPTNPPANYIRRLSNSSLDNRLQAWVSPSWVDIVFGIAVGGTGATTAAGARTSLGLGDMALQVSSAVSITGGTVQGILQAKGGNFTFDTDGTRDIGTNAIKGNRIYIKNALVIPVGTDKYATS